MKSRNPIGKQSIIENGEHFMTKLRFFFALGIIIQPACSMLGSTVQPTPVSDAPTQELVLASETASAPPTLTPSATVEPTLVPAPAIGSDSFGEAEALHEYWPAIREAAGLWEEAEFGLTATAWALSPDGRYLAVAGCDTEAGETCEATINDTVAHAFLFILDAKTESLVATLPETGQELTVTQLKFTKDGNKLVYGLDSGKVQIWDVASGRIQAVINEKADDSLDFAISPNDKWIALENRGLHKIWDIAGEKFIAELPNGGFSLFSADGQRLLIEDYPYLVFYDTSTWQKTNQQILMPDGDKNTYDISPDLSLLAICDTRLGNTPIRIFNATTGELIQTLEGEWGRCGRLIFSPDGRLLLRFDEHGAGPVIWEVDGWKFVQPNPFKRNFVENKDLFVGGLEFSQDGKTMLVDTFERLTLYGLPSSDAVQPPSATSTPLANLPAATPATPSPMTCDIVVSGAMNLHVQPCLPPSRVSGGSYDGITVDIWMKDYSAYTGVRFAIPLLIYKKLQPREYVIGEAAGGEDTFKITAYFDYFDPASDSGSNYNSYEGGTLTFTQVGAYISGTFEFGAKDRDKRQIHVKGSFENIPFAHVNVP
jgi:WD40 repeat protein